MANKKLQSYKDSLMLTNHMRAIMVGLLLGDANLQTFSKEGKTWRLRIIQGGESHLEYIKHLRELFDPWTNMDLATNNETRKDGKVYHKWFFNTLAFTQFAELGNSFYPIGPNGKRTKVIPSQLEDWMTDVSLAYWFMDDGARKWGDKVLGIRFCSDSFSSDEVDKLICILNHKFDLIGTKNKDGKGWRINISTKSYDKVADLIYPHLIPSMKNKFPIKK